MINPLTDKHEHPATILRSLASQENCDGVPYDQMQEAADYICKLEKRLTIVEKFSRKKTQQIIDLGLENLALQGVE
jgi:hypothetical protein